MSQDTHLACGAVLRHPLENMIYRELMLNELNGKNDYNDLSVTTRLLDR